MKDDEAGVGSVEAGGEKISMLPTSVGCGVVVRYLPAHQEVH
jgi:hypothetical protein